MSLARIISGFLGRRPVQIALSLGLTLLLGALLVATIHYTRFDLQWLAFLGGVLFAAVLAMASHASKAEWLIARRTRQLERVREQLVEETDRGKSAAEALRMADLRMRMVGDALPLPIFYVDRDLCCRYHNQACRMLTALPAERIDGQPLQSIAGTVYPLMLNHLERTLAGAAVSYELAWPGDNDAPLRFTVSHLPFPPRHERPFGFYILLTPAAGHAIATQAPQRGSAPADAIAIAAAGAENSSDGGNSLYLRSITDQLMGHDDDPRAKLQRALREDQFLLFTQKILPLKSGAPDPVCHEILLRMQEEEDNLLPPGGFIPIAEENGMMEEIDRWVVRNLISWSLRRQQAGAGWRPPLFCINLSGTTLANPDFASFVRHELQRSGFAAQALCFEISDIEAMSNHANVRHFISALKPAGCRFALDDFGSAKVSFSHLRGLAVDFIKVDGAIIQNILKSPTDLAKLQAIVTVCQKIGVRTIAEFVESGDTLNKLRELGIDYAQGFGVARPGPIAELP
jgi:EAL domain-containing protein (putative c-di-GMP-specific phosphodiesterase class I)/PAS domain-containing protein